MNDIENFPLMLESFKTVLTGEEFSCKSMSADSIKVNTNTTDAYRKLVHFQKISNVFHTHQSRQQRSYRVVIKNLHIAQFQQRILKMNWKTGF